MKAIAQPTTQNQRGYAFAASAAALMILWAAFYAPVIPPLVREWYEHENFSYGFLIPLISVYLAFAEGHRLKNIEMAPEVTGVLILGGALAIGILGNLLGEAFVARISLVCALGGLIWAVAGRAYVRALWFSLAYLFLMVPPPYVIVKQVSYYLKMFDATVATAALQAIGVPVYRDSYFLDLPTITLEVADVCSGIASLFAMISLGAIYVYYLPTRVFGKFLVLAGTLIFPVLANLIRITLVGATVYWFGPIMLSAFYHRFTGTFTFSLGVAMLLGFGELLRRRYPARAAEAFARSYVPNEREAGRFEFANRRSSLVSIALAGVVLVIALYGSGAAKYSTSVGLRHDLREVSGQIGGFHVAPELWPDAYSDSQAERSLSRLYVAPDETKVEMFIGYLGSQSASERLRSPKLVFPAGWEYASIDNTRFRAAGEDVNAVWLVTKKNGARRLVLFWYQLPGQTYSSDVLYRLALARRLILRGRTDGAVIRLATELRNLETVDQGLKRLIHFASGLGPDLKRLLPPG